MSDVVGMLKSGQEDLQWFSTNFSKLTNRYNNRFVAFKNKNILDSDANLDELLNKLDEKHIDRNTVLIEFVSKVRSIL
jgi:hypothetical protein